MRPLNSPTKVFLTLLALAPLVGCTARARAVPDDPAVLALGIPGAVLVEPHLVSSGQYDQDQFSKLPALGYDTVIQLRPASEEGAGWEEAQAAQLGLKFLRIPVAGAQDITEANALALEAALKNRDGGTLVACSSGNRVGGLLALRAYYVDKLPPEEALEVGKRGGLTRAEPAVRKLLGLPESN